MDRRSGLGVRRRAAGLLLRPWPQRGGGAGAPGAPLMAALSPVGFVGLGEMGLPMARVLLRAGFPVVASDLRPDAVAAAVAAGASAAGSMAELGACPVVAMVVVSDAQVAAVGQELLGHLRPGAVIVVHSTVRPETVVALAEAAARCGVDVLDAPVRG